VSLHWYYQFQRNLDWLSIESFINFQGKKVLVFVFIIRFFFLPFSSQNDIEAAREAYDAFLSHYPYCYGYWRKYADYEKRKGNKEKCEEVRLKIFVREQ
jgi:hypothetical protein